jgi:uncharacterized protein YfaS (alpha-2-macroglobulin family)
MRLLRVIFWTITLLVIGRALPAHAQSSSKSDNYTVSWGKVKEFEDKGLPESALKVVNDIYAMAQTEHNSPQLVKAVIHILKFTQYKEEDAFVKNLNKLKAETEMAVFPARPLLHSMLAELYWRYYEANRFRFRQRTATTNFINDDISTWSLDKIVEESVRNYQLSLQSSDRSKTVNIDIYEDILNRGNGKGRAIRPTLFDFLANRAVDYYMGDEPSITKPAYSFSLNAADYFKDADDFSRLDIVSKDSLSYKFQALKLFQSLISFHLRDEKADALVDVDLKRLQFVKQNSILSNKQELYLGALSRLEQRILSSPASAMVTYFIAQEWAETGRLYDPVRSAAHKWDLKKANDICQTAINRFPESGGGMLAINLQYDIHRKTLSAETERINVPNLPFRALISYGNFTNLQWRIVKTSREEVKAEREKWANVYAANKDEKFLAHFIEKSPVKSGNISLPDDKDFQKHSVEVKIDGVPPGDYLVLFSPDATFKTSGNSLAYTFTTVSNLSYIHRNLDDGSTEFYVLNRTSGEPIQGATAQVLFNTYNAKSRGFDDVKGDTYLSDARGMLTIPFQKSGQGNYNQAYVTDFSFGNDKISTRDADDNDGALWQQQQAAPPKQSQTIFFTDRSIYRPGQTLYFKGILFSTDGKTPEILTRQKQTITFYDTNDQVVSSQDVVTNEYGTFNGTFTTPSSVLTGQMHLQVNDNQNSSFYFSVEEYKRPKFEVKLDSLQGSYRLGDEIKATGAAMTYSGAVIDGASVSYRVVRQTIIPLWWKYWYGYYPSTPEMEITNGQATTDANGKFVINFRAIPDESVDKKTSPVFLYHITADVTDINGETHTGQSSVSIGYKALVVDVKISDLDKGDEKTFTQKFPVVTANQAGKFVPAKGSIKIWKLKTPSHTFRNRLWAQPDTFVMTKDEFYKSFPHDLYKDETNSYKWEKEKEVLNVNFDSSTGKNFSIPGLKNWDLGKYQLEITSTDKYEEEVKELKYFDVHHSQDKSLPYPSIHLYKPLKTEGEPGETAMIQAGSSEKVNALYEIEQDGKIIDRQRFQLNNEKRSLEIPIKEEYRGNIAVHYVFVRDNRLYNETSLITVPYTNKQLDITFETFRDKLQPGQQEQWKLRIASKKGDKAMAEMVATMYDASLDAFSPHEWMADFYQSMYARLSWLSMNGFNSRPFRIFENNWNPDRSKNVQGAEYDALNWFGYNFYGGGVRMYRKSGVARGANTLQSSNMNLLTEDVAGMAYNKSSSPNAELKKAEAPQLESHAMVNVPASAKSKQPEPDYGDVKIRKNFNETAFFFPLLQTNENGEITISFTMPEALTRWKMMGFAHTQDLKSGITVKELVTQKDLMVVPNQPRFFRENDKMVFSAKITSLLDKEISGTAQLEFFDALTMNPISEQMKNVDKQKSFNLSAKQSTNLEWTIEIPEGIQAITYRIAAKAGSFSDGEEMILPVVTNRMLVTETLPLPVRGNQTRDFKFEKLLNNNSPTLKNFRFTLEFTSNPAWYAVQALPYLMEYPYECTEQTFSRFYANAIASHIANANPKIKRVFDAWAAIQPDALISNLEKNQELKSALLEETPWVLNAKDESQRKRNVALLFDLNKMASEQQRSLKKILDAQLSNGGFSWFPGLPEDRYMTQYIVAQLGHLDVMGVKSVREDEQVWQMVQKALGYIDARMQDRFEYLKAEEKKGHLKWEEYQPDDQEIQYLYARSYFKDVAKEQIHKDAFDYFLGQANKYWLKQSIYMQGMVTLALNRFDVKETPQNILKSLSERALHSDEMGMYWKTDKGYFWYQAPIETQALLIEVYDEVGHDTKSVEELKTWLLKQKQTQDWRTTKATAEACYALLRRGTDILSSDKLAEITVGGETIDPSKREDIKTEAGTGYFKTAWTASQITPQMGNIRIAKKDDGVAWGAAYWQYFEQLDKITPSETPLSIHKQLFLQQNTDKGPVISPITENTPLKVGDMVKVRIELRADRSMEYLHLKDMRAAGFEPVETLSTFKYQDGLWYYQSPRDLATNFFIGYLPKGTYVFEYSLRVSQKGDFSNGVTTVQCMYAPEFSSHSEGIRVRVK